MTLHVPEPDALLYRAGADNVPTWMCALCSTVREHPGVSMFRAWSGAVDHLRFTHGRYAVYVVCDDPTRRDAVQLGLPFALALKHRR